MCSLLLSIIIIIINDCEYVKNESMNCRWRNEHESDLRSNEHYASSIENK